MNQPPYNQVDCVKYGVKVSNWKYIYESDMKKNEEKKMFQKKVLKL